MSFFELPSTDEWNGIEVGLTRLFFHLYLIILFSTCVFGQSVTPQEAKERIEKATPTALPQTPAVTRVSSDAKDEGLKGLVRSVLLLNEYENGMSQTSSEDLYDRDGMSIRHVSYDYQGNPWQIVIYGYIDGKRVTSLGYISYDYDPPLVAAPRGGSVPKLPADTRYAYRYEYTYDGKGMVTEKLTYANTGKLSGKTTYAYDGDKRERASSNSDGKNVSKAFEVYNAKGNMTHVTYPGTNSYGDSVYTFKYEKFDSHGNWTRRIQSGKAGQYGGGQKDFRNIEIRKITYY
jgi:hypothetical protein